MKLPSSENFLEVRNFPDIRKRSRSSRNLRLEIQGTLQKFKELSRSLGYSPALKGAPQKIKDLPLEIKETSPKTSGNFLEVQGYSPRTSNNFPQVHGTSQKLRIVPAPILARFLAANIIIPQTKSIWVHDHTVLIASDYARYLLYYASNVPNILNPYCSNNLIVKNFKRI